MGTEEEHQNQAAAKDASTSDTSLNDNNNLTSVEGEPKKLPYPKSVFFIISNEFCERFNYYGMRTILALYLTRKLAYSDDEATVIYHAFTAMVYLCCLFGAVISDSFLGKFRTIFYLSVVYACGSMVIAIGAIPTIDVPAREATFLGLGLIALGSGGIKPCVAAFGGDQFKLPAQLAQMATYFSIFYFSINSGSLISTAVTPILRQDVHCFGELECFSAAFGVPGVLMIVSIVIFVLGKPLYRIIAPTGNMIVRVANCIGTAISSKGELKATNPREHWLDYAEEKCGKQIVQDTKVLLKILVLYIPLPLFWALFDQQGSRWTFQATRMNGDIGIYDIKPDQLQLINPLLILVFIPLYEMFFYPFLSLLGIRRPLQKLTLGGIFAGIAFLLSAAVETKLEATYPVMPRVGEAQLRLFNGFPCSYTGHYDGMTKISLGPYGYFEEKHIDLKDGQVNTYPYTFTLTGPNTSNCPNVISGSYTLSSKTARSVFLSSATPTAHDVYVEEPNKSRTGDPVLRILFSAKNVKEYGLVSDDNIERHRSNSTDRATTTLLRGNYRVVIDGKLLTTISLQQGGVQTLVIREANAGVYEHILHVLAPANSMSMMWLLPQYIVMTLGEVMFSVTGLSFSYSQAPESMKSVLQACWLLAVAIGNIFVSIIASAEIFKSQVHEFLLFAILMFVDMLLFMVLAYYYKGIECTTTAETTDEVKDDEKRVVPSAPALNDEGHTNAGFKE